MNIPQNILIVRADRIGDVILTIPMAEIIKKYYPESRVSFLVKNYTAPLFHNHKYIDEVFILNDEDEIDDKSNVDMLKAQNFDCAITVSPTFKIAKLLYKSKIKRRIGTGHRLYSFLFNERIFVHRKYAEKHELEYNVEMLSKIGIEHNINKENVSFNIQVSYKSEQRVRELLEQKHYKFDKKTIIIHPGSGGSAVDWPKSKFRELVKMLARELKVNIIITGSESEIELCGKIAGNSGAINLAGKVQLKELVAVLNYSDIMLANSTGPIHIAVALGKFVIGFYPKITECLPQRWGPYTNKSKVFVPTIGCDNCTKKQCQKLDCMSSIDTESVFDEIIRVLKN